MKHQAILFDAVGTLIYPNPDVITVYQHFGSVFSSSKTNEEVQLRFSDAYNANFQSPLEDGLTTSESIEHARWQQVVKHVFDDLDVIETGLFDELWQYFGKPESWSLYDDVVTTWEKLASQKTQLGIASNFDGRLRNICRQFPIMSTCDYFFISTEVGFSKPSPRFYQRIAESLALAPSELLMVGDSMRNDVVAASECGWEVCLLQRSPAITGEIKTIQSLRELL